jgi:hypothetical protein
VQALAADAVLLAAGIGTVAEPRITRLLAFHGCGLAATPRGVNSDRVVRGTGSVEGQVTLVLLSLAVVVLGCAPNLLLGPLASTIHGAWF